MATVRAPLDRDPPMTTGAGRTPTPTERDLARRLATGDPDALRELYDELAPVVLGYLRRALGDADRAEDVLQQVFAEVWRRGAAYDPERASPVTWVMLITRSRAIDELRRHVPEPVDPASFAFGQATTDAASPPAEDLDRVPDLLARLPDTEARVLRLRFLDELSQTEIAARTGLPLGTVKSRMLRGLERLRELLEEDDR